MKFKNVIISILLLSSVLFGANNKKLSINLRCGYYLPSSSTYNDELVPAISANLYSLNAWLLEEGLTANLTELGKINGRILCGGELEFYPVSRFSVAVGAQIWQNNLPPGSLKGGGTIDNIPYDISEKISIKASLVPIVISLRAHFLTGKIDGYIGGGAGYYMGKLVIKEEWNYQISGDSYDSGSREIESRGNTILPHINGGIIINLTNNVGLSIDARYPLGEIKAFTIKRDTLDPTNVGEKFIFEEGVEKQFKWELNGIDLGINLIIKF